MISPVDAPNRRDRQGYRDVRPVLAQPDGFEMVDVSPRRTAPRTWSSSACRSGGMITRIGLADHLGRGVAEEPLGGTVPRHDHPVQILADDGVVARLDDGGEMPRVPLEPLALRQIGPEGRLHS